MVADCLAAVCPVGVCPAGVCPVAVGGTPVWRPPPVVDAARFAAAAMPGRELWETVPGCVPGFAGMAAPGDEGAVMLLLVPELRERLRDGAALIRIGAAAGS